MGRRVLDSPGVFNHKDRGEMRGGRFVAGVKRSSCHVESSWRWRCGDGDERNRGVTWSIVFPISESPSPIRRTASLGVDTDALTDVLMHRGGPTKRLWRDGEIVCLLLLV